MKVVHCLQPTTFGYSHSVSSDFDILSRHNFKFISIVFYGSDFIIATFKSYILSNFCITRHR